MPVDAATVDMMFNPFRGMLAELRGKGIEGEDVDECAAALAAMDAVATVAADITEMSTRLGTSGLYQRFSDAYTRAMIAAASPAQGAPQPTDEELLGTTLAAYQDAATRLQDSGDDEVRKAIPPVQRVLELGRSGVTYPVFLRRMEEEGLTDALAGAVVMRSGLERDLDFAREMRNPVAVARAAAVLAAYDELAAAAPFKVPDPFELGMQRRRIDWEYEPALITRRMLQWRWSLLVNHLIDWVDAHTSFAPTDARWAQAGASPAVVQRNMRMSRECDPGRFRARERIMVESFGHDFPALDALEFVANDIALGIVGWSDERLDLARETYNACVPGATAPPALVARSEELHARGSDMRTPSPAPANK